jgi:hypothetical protein
VILNRNCDVYIKSVGSGDLIVGQTFITKDNLVNAFKQWHIIHSLEYCIQRSNQTFV